MSKHYLNVEAIHDAASRLVDSLEALATVESAEPLSAIAVRANYDLRCALGIYDEQKPTPNQPPVPLYDLARRRPPVYQAILQLWTVYTGNILPKFARTPSPKSPKISGKAIASLRRAVVLLDELLVRLTPQQEDILLAIAEANGERQTMKDIAESINRKLGDDPSTGMLKQRCAELVRLRLLEKGRLPGYTLTPRAVAYLNEIVGKS